MTAQYIIVQITYAGNEEIVYHTIDCTDIDKEQQIDSYEKDMGSEVCHQLSYICDEFEMRCDIYEYPIGTLESLPEWEFEIQSNKIEEIEIIKDTIQYEQFITRFDEECDEE